MRPDLGTVPEGGGTWDSGTRGRRRPERRASISPVSSDFGYKVCPTCGEEYTLVMERCADCDVALVSPDQLPSEQDADPAEFPPASELFYLRVAPLPWIQALSNGLEEAGVPHRVEPGKLADPPDGQRPETFGDVDLFALFVLPEDAPAASELDSQIAARVLPHEAEDLQEGEEDACPACGTRLSAEATTCADCGLGLG